MGNNQTPIDPKKYLVTEKSDINKFSREKITNDLDAIKKAELRSQVRTSKFLNKKENEVSRAMNALSLINPFRGA